VQPWEWTVGRCAIAAPGRTMGLFGLVCANWLPSAGDVAIDGCTFCSGARHHHEPQEAPQALPGGTRCRPSTPYVNCTPPTLITVRPAISLPTTVAVEPGSACLTQFARIDRASIFLPVNGDKSPVPTSTSTEPSPNRVGTRSLTRAWP
jgi:hypothetical protein